MGRLEGLYTVLMSALGVAIFVFGLLLHRAKEHVTMRALGLRMVHLQGLVLLTGLSSVVAGASLRRLRLVEILREE